MEIKWDSIRAAKYTSHKVRQFRSAEVGIPYWYCPKDLINIPNYLPIFCNVNDVPCTDYAPVLCQNVLARKLARY